MDPLETQGGPTLLRGTKRPRATTEFSVLMEQLRSMADFLPQTVSDDDLAQDMGARIAMLAQGSVSLSKLRGTKGGSRSWKQSVQSKATATGSPATGCTQWRLC